MTAERKKLPRKFTVDCCNGTRDLLNKTGLKLEKQARTLHISHISRYHWDEI